MLQSIVNYFRHSKIKKDFNDHINRSYGIAEAKGKYAGAEYLIKVAKQNPRYMTVPWIQNFIEGLKAKYE